MLDEEVRLWIKAPEADSAVLAELVGRSPLALSVASERPAKKAVVLEVVDAHPQLSDAEGYVLTIGRDGVVAQALSGAGLLYAMQPMLQMVGDDHAVPKGTIVDYPRFGYRGMMIDVSRHFFDVEFIKKQIDVMAYYKLNHLHLHLTDAAGWRLEIERNPRLMELAAWRADSLWKVWAANGCWYVQQGEEGAYGGYYTKGQVREIVAYAQKHNITVVPEIEMPSHSEEVLAAYPQLSCSQQPYADSDFCVGNEQVFEFLEDVLLEVMELFPSPYIHIGGDEASKQAWKRCPRC